jgi:hypothetical protein
MQEDPLGLRAGGNLYGYAGNDPLMYTDPSGLLRTLSPGESTSSGIQALEGLSNRDYNCHYAAKSFIEKHWPSANALVPEFATLTGPPSDDYMKIHGYTELLGPGVSAHPGDIITVDDPNNNGQRLSYTHTAIVNAVDANGNITEVVQKPDGAHPWQGTTQAEFERQYLNGSSIQSGLNNGTVSIWSNPARAGQGPFPR